MRRERVASGMTLRLLVVEDDRSDQEAIASALADTGADVDVTVAERLDDVGAALAGNAPYDAVVLDLGLPDSAGLPTVVRICTDLPDTPVVVLTGNADTELPAQALRAGAEDYLVKSELDGHVLLRTLQHSVERHQRVKLALQRAYAEHGSPPSSEAQAPAPAPLRERHPERFVQLSRLYRDAIVLALDHTAYHGSPGASRQVAALAGDLGVLSAGPRDAVELHILATEGTFRELHPDRARAREQEGRMLLLELLGHLTSYYRNRYLAGGDHLA